ncbi:MAG: hypothetical protein ACSW79_02130, partial [Eubacteriales bacterium]
FAEDFQLTADKACQDPDKDHGDLVQRCGHTIISCLSLIVASSALHGSMKFDFLSGNLSVSQIEQI